MLDLDKIVLKLENEIKTKYGSQKEFAQIIGVAPSELTKDKKEYRIHSLTKLQKYADWLNMDIEPLVLPGLTQAAEYINTTNIYAPNQKGVNKSGSFGQGGHTGMYNVNKGNDKELQELKERYFQCVDKTQSLYEELREKDGKIQELIRENTELKSRLSEG